MIAVIFFTAVPLVQIVYSAELGVGCVLSIHGLQYALLILYKVDHNSII